MIPHGLLIAAPRSGSGKTTVALGLIAALVRRGVPVRAAKAGPDYIDPAFHAAASGHDSLNLDSWAMPPALLDATLAHAAAESELLVVETAMGLFDGVDGPPGRRGRGADLAARFRMPVLLVLDISGQSQSVAAVAHGFATLDPAVRVAGVILNRVASPRHHAGAASALRDAGIAVLGSMPREAGLALPERHLGLVQAREHGTLAAFLDTLAAMAERDLDLGAILRLAAPIEPAPGDFGPAIPPPGQRIAIADDAAFSFLYPHLAQGWQRAGAELLAFSPLADEPPPDAADCCWLPGGYPELHAGRLAAASRFHHGLTRFAETRPVHGECGGYMVLGQALTDAHGTAHAMTGLLGHSTSYAKRRMHLGYREATLLADTAIGRRGQVLRGHEFHYASVTDPGADPPLAELADAAGNRLGPAGGRRGLVSGSFFHAIAVQPTSETP
ncbi:cobyrinate a,c-diamide synthase [Lichenicola sp.]|uniref:cobyrinate a,c-diamide synthase n=1 Tax=Lichenicola sp. TaxID=2804529 RepID=UPI003B004063